MSLAEKLNREWLEERLARAPAWYLGLYSFVNVGFATTWVVLHLRSGHIGWTIFFGVLDAIAVAIVLSAVHVKRRRRREAEEILDQLPKTRPRTTNMT